MSLFNFKKKKEEESCCCSNECSGEVETTQTNCCCCNTENCKNSVKVLGAGCKSCHDQYENVKTAVKEMGLDADVEYITDMEKVMSYGVMSMPAIVVNEKVVSMGKVLKVSEVKKILERLE